MRQKKTFQVNMNHLLNVKQSENQNKTKLHKEKRGATAQEFIELMH